MRNQRNLSDWPEAIRNRALIEAIYTTHRTFPTKESLDTVSELSSNTLECLTRLLTAEPCSDFERSVRALARFNCTQLMRERQHSQQEN